MKGRRPRLLDLFCGAGGASVGYARAGFDVVGVDIRRQPHYPFDFVLFDALDLPLDFVELFDAVHASPPCQRWADGVPDPERWPDLLAPTRAMLDVAGLPYLLENVKRAPLRRDVLLCGSGFGLQAGGFEVRRHRVFELGRWQLGSLVPPCTHTLPCMPVFGHGPGRDFYARWGRCSTATMRAGMDTPWMGREEMREAIPPAFSEFLGHCLVDHLVRTHETPADFGRALL